MGRPMSTIYVPDEYGRLVPTQMPTSVGFIGLYAGPEPPDGYLYCDGSAIGREAYRELFDAIGTLYGAGDGAETFNLPDARGIFFRGDGGDAATMGVRQGDATRNIRGGISLITTDYVDSSGVRGGLIINPSSPTNIFYTLPLSDSYAGHGLSNSYDSGSYYPLQQLFLDSSRVVPTAAENRPINLAMKPCIRYV